MIVLRLSLRTTCQMLIELLIEDSSIFMISSFHNFLRVMKLCKITKKKRRFKKRLKGSMKMERAALE
jgi:hypothetical protein